MCHTKASPGKKKLDFTSPHLEWLLEKCQRVKNASENILKEIL